MAASGHADDAVPRSQCRRKIIEHVRRIAAAGQQEQGRAGTAPIEHLQPDVGLNFHQLHHLRRRVVPLRPL